MGTTGTTPSSFTGSSAFSAQLQQVIANAVSSASGPMQQLQSQETALSSQQSELQTLSSNFQSVQMALDAVNTAAGLGAYSASVDNTSVASASISSGVMPGTYSLNVTGVGARTSTMSANGLTTVTDPTAGNIDSSSTYTLTVNGQNYQITNGDGSLNGLVAAINSSGANVQATVVNVGSSGSPDYRLSIQSLNYAPDTVQLSDGTNNLLNTLSPGSYVQYKVNGQTSTINSDSRTVNLSPGLSVDLLSSGTANITVSQSVSGIASAITSFANAYNSAVDELTKNRGQNGGALSGQSIVYELQSALQSLGSYTGGSGNITSLSQLGITFDLSGHLQVDQATLSAASTSDTLSFFGSESGGGFLQAANNILTSVTGPTTGLLPNATQSVTGEISSVNTTISNDQQQVSALQTSLTSQMAAADAAISSMEQQAYQITDLFTQMQQYTNPNGL